MAKSILVVDDDPDARRILRAALEGLCEVREAANGSEALKLLSDRPSMILLDLTMPVLGGMEVLHAVRTARGLVPVLILTSERDLDTAKRALELGASAYVTKPFDLQFLRDEVERLLSLKPKRADGDPPWRVSC
jgi:CheY-like chemotaxis protein